MLVGDDGTVPKERYVSRAFLDLEMERLWPRVWQVACREEELADVGDYVDYVIGDQSILVVRAAPDTIKAYFNTCLHRGTRLGEGCGSFAGSAPATPFKHHARLIRRGVHLPPPRRPTVPPLCAAPRPLRRRVEIVYTFGAKVPSAPGGRREPRPVRSAWNPRSV